MLDAALCFHILHSAWYLVPAVYDTVGEKISSHLKPEPVFENVYGAQESIPRNLFRQLK
jgi:hypothetical protein